MKGIPREVEVIPKRTTITNSRRIRLLRQSFSLTSYQKQLLIGTLLGDGSLTAGNWAKNYRLQMVQGDEQKEYLFWKFDAFRNCCISEPSHQRWNNSWRIRTISHTDFNYFARMFYKNNKKIVPKNIAEYLKPLTLAIWFMDDGSYKPTGYILNTQSFSYEENKYLRNCLISKFSFENVSINKDRRWWRLYIYQKSAKKFQGMIDPYIIPSMRYKLLTP